MKPITEEQHQELIERGNDLLEMLGPVAIAREFIEIALASLTAESVAYTSNDALTDVYCGGSAMIGESGMIGSVPLYTSPPVPVINLPDENEGTEHTEYHAGKQEGWNDCIEEIKRLNAIS